MTENPGIAVPSECAAERVCEVEVEHEPTHKTSDSKLQSLYDERRVLARAVGVGLLIGTLLAFLVPAQYQSTTRLMPPGAEAGGRGTLLAGAGLRMGGSLLIGVLGSRTVEYPIIERFALKRVYGVRFEGEALEKLAKKTDIREDPKSGVITVAVTDRDPRRAAAMARAYVDGLNSAMVRLNTSSAHTERVFLEERLGSLEPALQSAEKRFGEFSNKTGVIDIAEQDRSAVEATIRLKGQMNAAESGLAGLRQTYNEGNIEVRQARAQITELGHQLGKLGGQSLPPREETDPVRDSVSPSLRALPILGVTYADFDRELNTQEGIVETLTNEYELAKLQEARDVPTAEVLDPPEVPEKRSYPSRLWIILAGTAGISGTSVLWILGKSYWNRIDSEHPGKAVALEVFRSFERPFERMPEGTTARGSPGGLQHKPGGAP